ncbi:hypothetical protein TNCV_3690941 [Trichonephila clavipes]|nr:hypothetical protein TNCV_3690941 [Trichonephila clavipes]
MSGLCTKRDRDKGRKWEPGAAKRKRKVERVVSNQVLTGHVLVQSDPTLQLNNSDEYYPKEDDHRHFPNFHFSQKLNNGETQRLRCCQVIYSQFGLAIHQNDHQARRRFVEWAQNEIAVVPDFHKRILFSDEAHFWLNGYVNKQNCRIFSEANPQVYVETPLHPEKLTVWCALWAGGILLQNLPRPQRYSQW